jgi:flagellar hook assembly protein FlgD
MLTAVAALPTRLGVQVEFTLSAPAAVSVRALSIAGRPARTVLADRACNAGRTRALWNGRDDAGLALPAGRYLVEVTARGDDGRSRRALTWVSLR